MGVHAAKIVGGLIGSLQTLDMRMPAMFRYRKVSSTGDISSYTLERFVGPWTISAESPVSRFRMAYSLMNGAFVLRDGGEEHREADRDSPRSPPLLGLVYSHFLPIWGGEQSFYAPLSAHMESKGSLRVEFGDEETGDRFGRALFETTETAVRWLELNGNRYERMD
jgi:hypothetical protein